MHDRYLDAAAAVAHTRDRARPVGSSSPRCTASAVRPRVEALRRAGFADVYLVPEQAIPDADFPTVAFPNPEEPGAIDLALARPATAAPTS